MRLVLALLVAVGVAAEPRPIGEAERSAVSVVASYLASGPEAVYARLAADAPLRDVAKEDALREIAVRMGPRDGVTWTLRTAKRDAAFRVAWVSGYEDGLLVRMRGGKVVEILTLAEGTRDSKAEGGPPHSKHPIVIAVVLAILGAVVAARWRLAGVVLLALATASALIAYRERPPKVPLRFVELRELEPVREALARGRDPGKQAHDVAILWMLQSGLAVQVGGTKDDPLASLTAAGKTPLAELLRARIALGEGNEDAAARAFERATAIAPVRDDLLYEAAFSLDNDRAKPFLDRMHALGSRDAEAYYRTKSFDALRIAWALEPKPREEMIRADLLTDLRAKALVSFFSATEPVRRSAQLATRSLDWPAGAKAIVTGELLRVELGSSAIEVPNGAALAPKDAQVVAATYRAQQRDAEALRDAQELLEHGAPASRTRIVRAAKALAHHNRWKDVLKLSNALGGHEDLRTAVEQRMRRIEARRKLLENAQTVATAHFDIRHDASINPAIASRIGDLLEAELARVQQKLPPFAPRRVTVNVLQWDQFRRDITASDHTLGLYDGEIFIPFAAVERFKREVVAIITHELTHALIAQATNDNAPRWFHEGVATRMELAERQENAFATTPVNLVLPVPLIDATMEKNTEPAAYVVAQTFIRFLEDRYGADAIAKIAAGFARGEETVLGKSLDTLNVEFRQWGFHHNGEFANDEPWPYDALYSPGIDPRVRAGFKF
jgi:Peptidase of plants and bacteria